MTQDTKNQVEVATSLSFVSIGNIILTGDNIWQSYKIQHFHFITNKNAALVSKYN